MQLQDMLADPLIRFGKRSVLMEPKQLQEPLIRFGKRSVGQQAPPLMGVGAEDPRFWLMNRF